MKEADRGKQPVQAAEERVAVAIVRQAVLVILLHMQGSYPRLPVIAALPRSRVPCQNRHGFVHGDLALTGNKEEREKREKEEPRMAGEKAVGWP